MLIAALWWGSLTGLGAVVVPAIVRALADTSDGRHHGCKTVCSTDLGSRRVWTFTAADF